MLNLLGCNKENFIKLIKSMNYKIIEKNKDIYFKYSHLRRQNNNAKRKDKSDNPFNILKKINIK